ncbi:Proline iminopeptidase [Sesbania bispinosa]|nr:Proline iminopeptidase [Sesbania bispinosa]
MHIVDSGVSSATDLEPRGVGLKTSNVTLVSLRTMMASQKKILRTLRPACIAEIFHDENGELDVEDGGGKHHERVGATTVREGGNKEGKRERDREI